MRIGEGVTGAIDLLRARGDQALCATQMRIDVGVKKLEEQGIQIRMDEARLRQQFLRRRLVERDRVRWEVLEDLDSSSHFLPAPRMDGQALEIQKDLDMVLGELDS